MKKYFIVIFLFPFYALSQSIIGLTLVNADNGQDISSLVNGQVLNLSSLPTVNLNVRANTTATASVMFSYDGNTNFRTESILPFALAGDDMKGNYYSLTPTTGTHILKATPYGGTGAKGTIGTALTVNFTVKRDAVKSLISGELKKWHKVTITFDGPPASESGTPNPFLNYRMNVTFSNGSESFIVPRYFAADGNAGQTGVTSGNKWRVNFSPNKTGTWTYLVSFRQGTNIAVSDVIGEGTAVSFNGTTGTFIVAASNKTGRDLRGKGLLKYVGAALLEFAETGEYFRKAGADAPENFLDYNDFDNTPNNGNYRKSYTPHIQDWKTGDPSWHSGKGKGIIGAVNYLSGTGANSFSFLSMNINGDDKNVYPYVSNTDFTRMDISKMEQWEMVFAQGYI